LGAPKFVFPAEYGHAILNQPGSVGYCVSGKTPLPQCKQTGTRHEQVVCKMPTVGFRPLHQEHSSARIFRKLGVPVRRETFWRIPNYEENLLCHPRFHRRREANCYLCAGTLACSGRMQYGRVGSLRYGKVRDIRV